MKKTAILCLMVLTIVACNQKETKRVSVEGQFSVEIPKYMVQTDTLNEDAAMQYINPERDITFVVLEESKEGLSDVSDVFELETDLGTLDGLTSFMTAIYLDDFSAVDNIVRETQIINDLPAKIVYIYGECEGKLVILGIAFIDGNETIYQLVASAPFGEAHTMKPVMQEMFCSFQVLKK